MEGAAPARRGRVGGGPAAGMGGGERCSKPRWGVSRVARSRDSLFPSRWATNPPLVSIGRSISSRSEASPSPRASRAESFSLMNLEGVDLRRLGPPCRHGRFDGRLRGAIHRPRLEHLVRRPGGFLVAHRGVRMMRGGLLYRLSIRLAAVRSALSLSAGFRILLADTILPDAFLVLALVVLFYIGYSAWLSAHQMPAEA